MHRYFIKTHWLIKKVFSSYVWSIPTKENVVYLTFDDGPHPVVTPFVLDELKKYGAKGTFFCIGKNVQANPEVYQRILAEGHVVGNHTQNHLNGWKTETKGYVNDIKEAAKVISSPFFRPPYGKIKSSQARRVGEVLGTSEAKIIMWDVLSADFDQSITEEECLKNVLKNSKRGSIIVFHDSEKAYKNLVYVLPRALEGLSKRGYTFRGL